MSSPEDSSTHLFMCAANFIADAAIQVELLKYVHFHMNESIILSYKFYYFFQIHSNLLDVCCL